MNVMFFGVSIFKVVQFMISNFQISKVRTSQNLNSPNAKFSFSKCQTTRNKMLGTQAFQHFQNFRFSDMTNSMFKDVPIFFLYCLKYFGDKYGGPRVQIW